MSALPCSKPSSEPRQRRPGAAAAAATYGHVGLRFDAEKARNVGLLRDQRYRETYDKILLRCLKQIQQECASRKSTIYVVPERLAAHLQPYQVDEVMRYLIVAMGVDRGFTVVKVNENSLYIRWTPPTPPRAKVPDTSVIQPPASPPRPPPPRQKLKTKSQRQMPPPPPRRTQKAAPPPRGSSAPPPPRPPPSTNPQSVVQDIDKLLASLK